MSILFVGDTHGGVQGDLNKLTNKRVWVACRESYPDFVIICGDFGFVFLPEHIQGVQREERYFFNWFDNKPWVTLFCRGNHDNIDRINNFPVVNMFDGEVHQLSKKVFHLQDGHVYNIDSKKIFVLGGAESIDKDERIPGFTWWPNEAPSYKEYYLSESNLEQHNWEVDYVVTHTCPRFVVEKLNFFKVSFNDPTDHMLSAISEKIQFKGWFFGHHHQDASIEINQKKYSCLYQKGVYIE